MGATITLAGWAATVAARDLPESARTAAPVLFLDWLGNAIGGSRGDSSAAMARFIDRRAPRGPATVVGRRDGLDPTWAAIANGQSAHVLECDDTHQASSSHPGAAVWAAMLALAEREDATLGEAFVANLRALTGEQRR